MKDHISRKELKQDKIRDTIEHGAEAVYSHQQLALTILLVVLVMAAGYGGWKIYHDRQTAAASAEFSAAMKAFSGHIGSTPDPNGTSDVTYPDETSRATDAQKKFTAVADKYSGTNPGRWARYYEALCLEDLEQHNLALEILKKISSGGDKELSSMAQYQTGIIYARTGKTDDAVKTFRALADKPSIFVSRPLVLLKLAEILSHSNPKEAATLYLQIKTEFANTPAIADEAARGLEMLAPKS